MKRSRSDPDINVIGTNEISTLGPIDSTQHDNNSYNLPLPIHGSPRLRRKKQESFPSPLARRPLKTPPWIESGDIVAPVYESLEAFTSGSRPIATPKYFPDPDKGKTDLNTLISTPNTAVQMIGKPKFHSNNDKAIEIFDMSPISYATPVLHRVAESISSLFMADVSPPTTSGYKMTDV